MARVLQVAITYCGQIAGLGTVGVNLCFCCCCAPLCAPSAATALSVYRHTYVWLCACFDGGRGDYLFGGGRGEYLQLCCQFRIATGDVVACGTQVQKLLAHIIPHDVEHTSSEFTTLACGVLPEWWNGACGQQ